MTESGPDYQYIRYKTEFGIIGFDFAAHWNYVMVKLVNNLFLVEWAI